MTLYNSESRKFVFYELILLAHCKNFGDIIIKDWNKPIKNDLRFIELNLLTS